jgi:hypothetical protein
MASSLWIVLVKADLFDVGAGEIVEMQAFGIA